MLHCWCDPGIANPAPVPDWLVEHVKNLESHYLGVGLHYIQEDHPKGIGLAVKDWMRRNGLAMLA